jgi:hypothetical protein
MNELSKDDEMNLIFLFISLQRIAFLIQIRDVTFQNQQKQTHLNKPILFENEKILPTPQQ